MKRAERLTVGKKKVAVKHRTNSRKPTPASWKPGQSGNPAGRPRSGFALAEVLREFLDEPGERGDRKRQLIQRLFRAATGKTVNIPAAKLIFDTYARTDIEERLARLEQLFAAKGNPDA
jgi:hypothetical protein